MLQSHQLVKQNYRSGILSEAFIASLCPAWSPTASSLFSHSALLEIHPINVIAVDCLTQSSGSLQSLLQSIAIAVRPPAVTLEDYPCTLQKELFVGYFFMWLILKSWVIWFLWCAASVTTSVQYYELTTLLNKAYIKAVILKTRAHLFNLSSLFFHIQCTVSG